MMSATPAEPITAVRLRWETFTTQIGRQYAHSMNYDEKIAAKVS